MATEIINGVNVQYGPQVAEKDKGYQVSQVGETVQLVIPFNYDALPTTSATNGTIPKIPAKSVITRAVVLPAKTAFAGGTSYNVGLSQPDGTVVDADGIFAAITLAQLNAGGTNLATQGALVNASVGANDVQVTAAATGTFTAGSGYIVIEYIKQRTA